MKIAATKGKSLYGSIVPSNQDLSVYDIQIDRETGRGSVTPMSILPAPEGFAVVPGANRFGEAQDPHKAFRAGEHFGIYESEEAANHAVATLADKQAQAFKVREFQTLARLTTQDPGYYDKVEEFSRRFKVPQSVVRDQFEEFQRKAEIVDYDPKLLAEHFPKTMDWAIQNPQHMALLKTESKTLAAIERFFDMDAGALNGDEPGFFAGAERLARLAYLSAKQAKFMDTLQEEYFKNMFFNADNQDLIDAWEETVKREFTVSPEDTLGKLAWHVPSFVAGSLAPMLEHGVKRGMQVAGPYAAASAAATAGTAGAAAPSLLSVPVVFSGAFNAGVIEKIYRMHVGESIRSMRMTKTLSDQPIDNTTIGVTSALIGVPNSALDYLSIKFASKLIPKFGLDKSAFKSIRDIINAESPKYALIQGAKETAQSVALETGTEGLQKAVASAIQEIAYNLTGEEVAEKDIADIWNESLDEMEAALWSFGPIAGVSGGAKTLVNAFDAQDFKSQRLKDPSLVIALKEQVKNSTIKSQPEKATFDFLQSVIPEDKAMMYMDSEAINRFFEEDEVGLIDFLEDLDIELKDYEEALQNGEMIDAPSSKIIAKIFTEKKYDGIERHVAFSPDGMTVSTALNEASFRNLMNQLRASLESNISRARAKELATQLAEARGIPLAEAAQNIELLSSISEAVFTRAQNEGLDIFTEDHESWLRERIDKITAGEESFDDATTMLQTSILDSDITEDQAEQYAQEARGGLTFNKATKAATIAFTKAADNSTFFHETGHILRNLLQELSEAGSVSAKADLEVVDKWTSDLDDHKVLKKAYDKYLKKTDKYKNKSFDWLTEDELKEASFTLKHEKFARGFERYLREGKAPNKELKQLFQTIKDWLVKIYRTVRPLDVDMNDDIRRIFDRLVAAEDTITIQRGQTQSQSITLDTPVSDRLTDKERAEAEKLKQKMEADRKEKLATASQKDLNMAIKMWKEEAYELINESEVYTLLDRLIRGDLYDIPVEKAEALLAKTNNPVTVLDETGWFKNRAGKWQRKATGEGLDREAFAKMFGYETVERMGRFSGLFKPDGMSPEEFITEANKVFDREWTLDDTVDLIAKTPKKKDFVKQYVADREAEVIMNLVAEGEHAFTQGGIELLEHDIQTIANIITREKIASAKEAKAANDALDSLQKQLRKVEAGTKRDAGAIKLIKKKISEAQKKVDRLTSESAEADLKHRAQVNEIRAWLRNRRLSDLRTEAQEFVNSLLMADLARTKNRIQTQARRHADRALKAATKNDLHGALKSRELQLIAELAVAELNKALAFQKASVLQVRKAFKQTSVDYHHHEWIKIIAKRFGLVGRDPEAEDAEYRKTLAPLESLLNLVDPMHPDEEPLVASTSAFSDWLVNGHAAVSWKHLQFDEFEEVVKLIKGLKKLGAKTKKIKTQTKTVAINDAAKEAAKPMEGLKVSAAKTIVGDTVFHEIRKKVKNIRTKLQASQEHFLENMTKAADGFKDDGPNAKYIRRVIKEARNRKLRKLRKIAKRTEPLAQVLHDGALERERTLGKRFDIPGVPVPTAFTMTYGNRKWTSAMVYAAVLNTGNLENLAALQTGWNLTDRQITALQNFLTQEEMLAIQGYWDLLGSLYPEVNEVHMAVYGTSIKRVKAQPFTCAHGTFKGGYYPIKIDAKASIASATLQEQENATKVTEEMALKLDKLNTFQVSTVSKGFTYRRTGTRMPVLLDPSIIGKHIDDVIHMTTHLIPIRDVDRLTLTNEWRKAYINAFGVNSYAQIRKFLAGVGRPDQHLQEVGNKALKWMVNRGTIFGLAWRPASMIRQLPAICPLLTELGILSTFNGYAAFLDPTNPKAFIDSKNFVFANSDYMRERAGIREYDAKLAERGLSDKEMEFKVGKRILTWRDIEVMGFAGLRAFEMAVSLPGWVGAYQKARTRFEAEGMTEDQVHRRSVMFADEVIESTQGAMDVYGLSTIQREWTGARLFTMFSSWGLQYGSRFRYYKEGWQNGKISTVDFARYIFYEQMLQPLLEFYLVALPAFAITGDEDEIDLTNLGRSVLSFYMGGRVISRQLGSLIGYGKIMGSSPSFAGAESASRALLHIGALVNELADGDTPSDERLLWLAKSTGDTASFILGVPASRVAYDFIKLTNHLED